MALIDSLFSRKTPAKTASGEEPGRVASDTQPSLPSPGGHSAERKSLRLERRELLYAVVRESMTRVGMLSSSYKFKVLSLDPRGQQYLIMMDLPHEFGIETGRMADIESIVAQNAQALHDIVVKAVYWRLDGPVAAAGLRQSKTTAEGQAPQAPPAAEDPAAPDGRFEPLRDDEVLAFKQALRGAAPDAASTPSEKTLKSWRRNPAPHSDFADTQIQEQPATNAKADAGRRDFLDTDAAELKKEKTPQGGNQYGDLS